MLRRILFTGMILLLVLSFTAQAEALLSDDWSSISRIPGSDDVYLVCRNEQWGLVNRSGEILLEPMLRHEPKFENGYAVAAVKSDQLAGDLSFPDEYASLYGVISLQGEIVIPLEYDNITLDARAGVAMVQTGERIGYMNLEGETFIKPKYRRAQMFVGNYAAAAIELDLGDENRDSMGYTTCWGVIDKNGREIIPFDYDMTTVCENGLFLVQLSGKSGVMNARGETIVPLKYSNLQPFTGAYAAAAVDVPLPDTSPESSEPIARSWGAIDESGREVIPCKYDSLQICENGLALAELNQKFGYLHMDGSTALEFIYDRAEPFTGDYAVVAIEQDEAQESGRSSLYWGVIDAEGNEILPLEYQSVRFDKEGRITALTPDVLHLFEIRDSRAVEISNP